MVAPERLLGRERELEQIGALIGRADQGGGSLLIHGDAGIGKSALLERAADVARAAGMRVLRTTGIRTEAHLPFASLHLLLRPILSGLKHLPGPQRLALGAAFGLVEGGASDAFLVGLATLTLLADSATDDPVLVVVDDAQWLDRPSADALAFVARRLGSDPLVLLVGLRDGEGSPIDGVGIEALRLQPLDDPDARDMLATSFPELAPSVRDRIVREAAGNPLALAELPTTVRDEQASIDALTEVVPLNARLERAFAVRVDDLPDDTRWLMLVAALDDRDSTSEIVAAAGVPASAFAPAVRAGLIEISGPSVRFRHPLMRSAIQQHASSEDGQRAHLALAAVVDDFDRAAWHRAAAADGPDESVAALLDRAADRAIRRGAYSDRGRRAPARGDAEHGRPGAWHSPPPRRGRGERPGPDGRRGSDAHGCRADRRRCPRGPSAGVDQRALADGAAVPTGERQPAVGRRRRAARGARMARSTWRWRSSSSRPPEAGGWIPGWRSGQGSPRRRGSWLRVPTTRAPCSSVPSRPRTTSMSSWRGSRRAQPRRSG
jgi:hypothetical protein